MPQINEYNVPAYTTIQGHFFCWMNERYVHIKVILIPFVHGWKNIIIGCGWECANSKWTPQSMWTAQLAWVGSLLPLKCTLEVCGWFISYVSIQTNLGSLKLILIWNSPKKSNLQPIHYPGSFLLHYKKFCPLQLFVATHDGQNIDYFLWS